MSEFLYGHWAIMETLRAGRRQCEQLVITETVEEKGIVAEIIGVANERGVKVKKVQRRIIDDLAQGANHQNMALRASPYPYVEVPQVLELGKTRGEKPFILLLDLLKASAPARIVNVASHSHYSGKFNFDDINMQRGYSIMKAYERSKLGNVLFTLELAERLKGTGITANSLHPGVVKTGIADKHTGKLVQLAWRIFEWYQKAISVEEGAKTSIYLASSPEVEGETGKYYDLCKHKWHSKYSQTEGLKEKVWELSEKLTGLKS